MLLVRWGTTIVSLVLASPRLQDGEPRVVVAVAALVCYSLYRTARPLRYGDNTASLVLLLVEAAGTVLAVVATGYWESPLAFSALTAVAVAGFARGFGFALRLSAAVVVATTLSWALAEPFTSDDARTALQWSGEVLLVGLVAGYARRITGEADTRRLLALDRLGRLSDANALLFQLHEVTQTLPASLDLDEVLDATISQISDLFRYDTLAVLLREDADERWHTVRSAGSRPPVVVAVERLQGPMERAVAARSLIQEPDLIDGGGPGLAGASRSGLYAPLAARGAIIGLVAIEHREPHHYTPRDADLLAGFVESAALAIDNGRWFARLRTVGADEERTRIARDLHDRIGQSLAFLAFELDRLVRRHRADAGVAESLDRLRGDVRGVIREVRSTLYDLRTDVSATQSLSDTLRAFLTRVGERSGLDVRIETEDTARLPILQEREMWRVAQEAITNAERHARATTLTIRWRTNGTSGALEVIDDGVGLTDGQAERLDSHGMAGMRDRAASIGATLTVTSQPGEGTRVRCALAGPH